ncbi:MAG TPA: metallophosphoesterase [Candidatus Aquilonibacter sp.]|nr:metallophosphoesterase [Candidatus Aquilonibacter sp.]
MPVRSPGRSPRARTITRRSFLAGASAAGLSLAAYSGTHARHELQVTHRSLAIRNLPDAFLGFHIVQISDIHLEEYTEPSFLEHTVRVVNSLDPDLVLFTGDLVSRGPLSDKYAWRAAGVGAEILEGLNAPQRFACLGNHDVAVGAGHVIAPLRAHGTPVLVDSYIPIQRNADYFWLCGSDDAGTRTPDLNLAIPAKPTAPVILMCHEPDYVDHVVRHPRFPFIDAMLSGHTHGGQVRLPVLGPLILPPMGKKYVEGRFQFEHMELYVNRGIGTVGLPVRLNCPAEITHFTLQRA